MFQTPLLEKSALTAKHTVFCRSETRGGPTRTLVYSMPVCRQGLFIAAGSFTGFVSTHQSPSGVDRLYRNDVQSHAIPSGVLRA